MALMHSVSTSVAVAVARRVNLLFPWRTCCLREEEETAAAKAAAEPTALTAPAMPVVLPEAECTAAAWPAAVLGVTAEERNDGAAKPMAPDTAAVAAAPAAAAAMAVRRDWLLAAGIL
eukprot:TRINITY_DN3672_c0_g1_i6.p2 TRINITY_DN3672_c0_g1~~TRINITY_DN3672_c0_g1_i6.p2  ORF type:complete len:118 (-),score=37.84 TRINITY_DN3672_c0_g1_i6:55-408(-)